MKKFKCWAKYTTYVDIDIEADTKEEAEEIAENTDGADFNLPDEFDSNWHIVNTMTAEVE